MTCDPGAHTPTVTPHPGDWHAQQIRAALERLKQRTATPARDSTDTNLVPTGTMP